jgi:hypothetical protein
VVEAPELKVRTVLLDDRLLERRFDVYDSLWVLVNALIPKCPRCRELLYVELREAERGVYRLVLVCRKCGLELVSSTVFNEVGA